MRDYTGRTVFLGIDVHKKTYSVTAIYDGVVVKKATLPASPTKLIEFCKRFFPNGLIKSAYEAGFCGFHLHRILLENGIENIVVDAASVEVAAGDRVKTDKRDSLKLATHLSTNRLKGIHVPDKEREFRRVLSRARDRTVVERTRVGNQIKALLHTQGLIPYDCKRKMSLKWIKALGNDTHIEEGLKCALKFHLELWLYLNEQIKEIDVELEKQAQEDEKLETIYRSTPGIGAVGSRVLANELEDMSQFKNERQLFSYTGLTPSEHSSGEHIRKGRISRQGKPGVRRILILAAWKAITLDQSLREIYENISKRAGGKKAIVAVARRLIGRIRSCFRAQRLYSYEACLKIKTCS